MVKMEREIQSKQLKQMSVPSPSSSLSPSPSPSPSSSACKIKKFKGVRMRSWGSWVSEIRAPNQKTRIWLGSYSTAEAAARAYDAALLCLKGSSANLNFPISTSSHYIPQDDVVVSPKSIQRIAAAAANNFVMDHYNNANITPQPSPSPSCSSPSAVSSPSTAWSPPLDQPDDEVQLTQSLGAHNDHEAICNMVDQLQPWYSNFEGLDDIDQMFNLVSFDSPTVMDDFEEEGYSIPLWSFC